jgi:hypothetical protein
MPERVYVLTYADYGDFRVLGVYGSPEDAEAGRARAGEAPEFKSRFATMEVVVRVIGSDHDGRDD